MNANPRITSFFDEDAPTDDQIDQARAEVCGRYKSLQDIFSEYAWKDDLLEIVRQNSPMFAKWVDSYWNAIAEEHKAEIDEEAARLAQPAAAVPDMAEFYLALGRYEAEAYKHGMTGRNALAVRAACEAVQHLYAQARAASPPAQVAVPEGWQPIETAPKSVDDILALYGDDRYCTSVLIGRCDIPCESGLGVLSGCVAECTLSDDGRWVYPMDPEFAGCFPEKKYGEVVEPTHWAKMPDLPEPPK